MVENKKSSEENEERERELGEETTMTRGEQIQDHRSHCNLVQMS